MDARLLEKFFKLYSKCSKAYSKLCGLDKYYIVSYYKSDNFIYSHQYIDFNLLFCTATGTKDNSRNPHLCSEFKANKNGFMITLFEKNFFDEVVILDSIQEKICGKLKDLDKLDILALNNIYKKIIKKV